MSTLPDPLPDEPLALFRRWFEQAHEANVTANPNAMVLATIDTDVTPPRPNARVVLCKKLDDRDGYVVFFTNYESRKGEELARTATASAVFHWDQQARQVRIEGTVVRSPGAESDAYFRSRHVGSRIGAWASAQSRPIDSRGRLLEQVATHAERFGVPMIKGLEAPDMDADIPRPPHWGGYRLWIEAIELWSSGTHRVHDRCRWERALTLMPDGAAAALGDWHHNRLQP